MPVGPLELADSVGLDILMHVAGIVGPTIGRQASSGIAELVSKKRLGEKSGRGFYVWENGKPRKQHASASLPPDSTDRLMLSLVNEAVACVADGVVADADLCDAGTIFGSGFAPFRGGPLQYARDQGIADVQSRLAELRQAHGDRFKASPGWAALSA
jgi:3-hydroxyacyl-CoA dehydrogenase/enoyl-CoA hydratase/3-hydroxybutyryl-CoA epimerase